MEMKKKTNQQIIDEYDYLSNAASAMDCTGLIPSLPETEEELESYNEVYRFCPDPPSSKEESSHTPS